MSSFNHNVIKPLAPALPWSKGTPQVLFQTENELRVA